MLFEINRSRWADEELRFGRKRCASLSAVELSRCDVFEETSVIQSIGNVWSFSIVLINSSLLTFCFAFWACWTIFFRWSLFVSVLGLCYDIGHYLLWMSVINQLNLLFSAARLIHLVVKSGKNSSCWSMVLDDFGVNYLIIFFPRSLDWFIRWHLWSLLKVFTRQSSSMFNGEEKKPIQSLSYSKSTRSLRCEH